jgi:hypothetical protein
MKKQPDWKKVLKADPTDWLLEQDDADTGSAGVRYLALRDIVEADEKEIKVAQRRAYREGPIARILENMAPEGYWVRPDQVYYPKFRGTVWSIMALAQLGGSVEEDGRIGTACSYLLDHALLKGGQFEPRGKASNIGLCLQGNMLTSLMDLGLKDSRLNIACEWMACRVTGEGLPRKLDADGLTAEQGGSAPYYYVKFITEPRFGCRTNKGLSCAWGGVNVMMAFSRLPVEQRSGLIKRAIEAGVDFFLSGDPSKAEFPGHRKGAPDKRWWQFTFPAFGTDILRIAEALVALGYGGDPRLASTIDLIRKKQDENGRWLLDDDFFHKHKTWVTYGSTGIPNKWVTLRALRVLKQAEEQKHK